MIFLKSKPAAYNFTPRGETLKIRAHFKRDIEKYFFTDYLFTPHLSHPFTIQNSYHLIAIAQDKKIIGYLTKGEKFIDVSNLY